MSQGICEMVHFLADLAFATANAIAKHHYREPSLMHFLAADLAFASANAIAKQHNYRTILAFSHS